VRDWDGGTLGGHGEVGRVAACACGAVEAAMGLPFLPRFAIVGVALAVSAGFRDCGQPHCRFAGFRVCVMAWRGAEGAM
jgi:hypothetical protein